MSSLPLRALPRLFVSGASSQDEIELPAFEVDKLRKVLRLSSGAEIAVLPNDGSIIRCTFTGRTAMPIEVFHPTVESSLQLTVAQSLPKGDKIDEIVRACTELGVTRFVLFPSERTVVKWDERKLKDRLERLRTIAREAAEISFRTRLPEVEYASNLASVLKQFPDADVLSESESESRKLTRREGMQTIVVGPEGGWSAREMESFTGRGVTLGPRVLRVDHAAPAAAAILLLA